MFTELLIVILFLCVINFLFNYNAKARLMRLIPGPKDTFIIGNMPELISTTSVLPGVKDPSSGIVLDITGSDFRYYAPFEVQLKVVSMSLMKLRREYADKFNGIFRFWSFPYAAINLYNANDIEIIIGNSKYNEKSDIYKFLTPWLGDGLLVSKGDKWQRRRKILTPAFHFNILRQFYDVLYENSQRLVSSLEKVSGIPIDIVPVVTEYTLNSICETAMGTKLSEETTGAGKSYKDAIYALGGMFYERFTKLYLYPDTIFNLTSLARTMKKHVRTLHTFTQKVINDRKSYIDKYGFKFNNDVNENVDDDTFIYKKRRKTAMLDLLLVAQKDGEIDDIGIQEEVDTFMFEGHDTTASGLTFCFMILANHKDIQEKIMVELNEIFGDSDRPAKMEDLSKMRYLECCIKESLRLYPPVHFISRSLNNSVTLSNYKVPAGAFCHILILDLHRHPELFEDPLLFNPDRFSPENSVGRHPYAYIPFSAGPRNCIGQKFAMLEMKSAVSEVLRKYELLPVTRPSDIEFTSDLILRNSGPVEVAFVKRQK